MPTLQTSAPALLVRNVKASADCFRDRCGFRYEGFHGAPPRFCMAWRDRRCVMLKPTDRVDKTQPNWTVEENLWDTCFWADEFAAAGATIDGGPCDRPWNRPEFGTQDLDRHDIGFRQNLGA